MENKTPYQLNEATYYQTFAQMLDDIENKYQDAPAISIYNRRGECIERSFHQFAADVRELAGAIASKGYRGAHIGIIGENSYHWIVAYFAAVVSGNVAVCVDIEQSRDMLWDMLHDSDITMAISSVGMVPVISEIIQEINHQEQRGIMLLLSDSDQNDYLNESDIQCPYQTVNDFVQNAVNAASALKEAEQRTTPEHPAVIVFTSGTTSKPKAVMLSHQALLINAADAVAMVETGKSIFGGLPLCHAYGMVDTVLVALLSGTNVCVNGNLKTMMRDMTLFKPEIMIAVPLIAESLYKMIWGKIEEQKKETRIRFLAKMGCMFGNTTLFLQGIIQKQFRNTAMENLTTIICGGAYLAANVAEDLGSLGILVLQGYGISECSPLVSVNRNTSYEYNSVGYVVPSMDVRIKDEEIQVKGKSVMMGYYNDPSGTAETMDGEWFKTGDIGYIDKKGHLYITGRIKNLIVMKNGKKIAPEEYEIVLQDSPYVKEVVAYGANSGNSVDDVKIAVMVYPDSEKTAGMSSYEILTQLQNEVDILNAKLPTYKQIQMINIRDTEFSKTASKKIKRKTV